MNIFQSKEKVRPNPNYYRNPQNIQQKFPTNSTTTNFRIKEEDSKIMVKNKQNVNINEGMNLEQLIF